MRSPFQLFSRLNKKLVQIAAWLAAMALAVVLATRFWSIAFPVASVPFPLTRAQSGDRMAKFVKGMGTQIDGYRSAVLFDESAETKNFIERQYGSARLPAAARDGVLIWCWTGRWFKPGQHEEYRASADPAGNIVGYTHIIEEERALPTLPQAQARQLAETFLQQDIPQHPFAALRFVDAGSEQKPNRTDYTFTWELDSLRMGDASYRLIVKVQGNEVGSYQEYLKVPEWWTVQFERERALNDLCYRVAVFGTFAVSIGLGIVFLLGISSHQVRWRDAVPWGWPVLFGIVAAASQFNNIPEIVFGYSTTEQWQPFVAGAIFTGVQSVLLQLVLFWLLILVGDCIYRELLRGKSSFRRALGPLALRDGQTVRAIGVGIAFAMFSMAYVCVFYAAGQRLGVWCPVDVNLSGGMSGPMPWVDAMRTGLTAAFTEEMLFRVGALLLIWRLIRVRWLAVLLSAAVWGFMHSNYPQMPGYTRGIELTIVGVVWGVLLLRYGVVATLTAHYLYDCWMGCLVSFQGVSWENKVAAVAVSTWPVALFLWGAWRKGGELEPEPVDASGRPDLPRPPPREWETAPLRLGMRGIVVLLSGCAVALAMVAFLPRPQHRIEELGKLDLSRQAIMAKADAALKEHGYSPEGYNKVTGVYAAGLPAEYLLEHGSLDGVADLFDGAFPDLRWMVRYFRFLQPEEFTVTLDSHGRFLTWHHTVLREAPGATLEELEALAVAKEALAGDGGLDLSRQDLVREAPMQQEHRRDWLFAFDQKNFNWGDAKLRTYIRVQGNEALDLTRVLKVPDAWILEHAKKGWKQLISAEFKQWVGLAEAAIVMVLLVMAIQKHLTPWRKAFLYALFPLGVKLADQLNQSQQFYLGYDTTVPRAHYLVAQLGTRLQALVWIYLSAVFLIAVALGFLHWAWGWTPEQLVLWPRNRRERGVFWRDSLLVALASISAFSILWLVNEEVLGRFWPAEVVAIHYWSIEEWIPWIGSVTEALSYAYDQMIRVAITASVLRLIWGRYPRLAWGLFLLLPLLNLGTPETFGGFLWGLVYAESTILLTAWLVLKLWRFNLLAVFLTYIVSSMVDGIIFFLHKGGPVYRWQAAPLMALMVLACVAFWWKHRENRTLAV